MIQTIPNDTPISNADLQDKIFIWKIIEPNASIIAACLPTYGPLLRGGRAPESIIRSVRSILSIGSHSSKGSRGLRAPKGLDHKSGNDSQINLNPEAPNDGGHDVQCISGEGSQDIELAPMGKPDGIEVTHGVSVIRH